MKILMLLFFSTCILSSKILNNKRLLEVQQVTNPTDNHERKLFSLLGPSSAEIEINQLRSHLAEIDLEIDGNQSNLRRGL